MFLEKFAFVFFILRKYINIKEAILWIKNACMKNMIENNISVVIKRDKKIVRASKYLTNLYNCIEFTE